MAWLTGRAVYPIPHPVPAVQVWKLHGMADAFRSLAYQRPGLWAIVGRLRIALNAILQARSPGRREISIASGHRSAASPDLGSTSDVMPG